MGFSLLNPLFAHSINLLAFLPCYSVISVVVLFDPCLLGLFWAYYMLFFHSITMTQYCHWGYIHASSSFLDPFPCLRASLAHFFLPRHIQPTFFPWASLAHSNSAFPWTFANSSPITISFTFGVYELSINPLLTYFITLGLPRPILAFILPMGLLLLFLGYFRLACFL